MHSLSHEPGMPSGCGKGGVEHLNLDNVSFFFNQRESLLFHIARGTIYLKQYGTSEKLKHNNNNTGVTICSSIIQEQLTLDSGSPWHGTSIYIFLMRFYAWFHFCGLHLTALLCRSTNKPIHHNWNMFLVPVLADKGAVKLRGRSTEPEIWAWLPALALFGTRYSVSWTSSLRFSSHQRKSSAYCLAFLLNTWARTWGQALGNGASKRFVLFCSGKLGTWQTNKENVTFPSLIYKFLLLSNLLTHYLVHFGYFFVDIFVI